MITSRLNARLEALRESSSLCRADLELGPLVQTEVGELLQPQGRNLTASELAWIAETSRGSPLYLRALTEELATIRTSISRAAAGRRGLLPSCHRPPA